MSNIRIVSGHATEPVASLNPANLQCFERSNKHERKETSENPIGAAQFYSRSRFDTNLVRIPEHPFGESGALEFHRNPAADRGGAASTGGAHRAVSGRTGGADLVGLDISGSGCHLELLAGTKQEPDGKRVDAGRRHPIVGSQREGFNAICIDSGEHGEESYVDFLTGRGISQSTGRRNDSGPDLTRASQSGGQSENHATGDCGSAVPTGDCNSTYEPTGGLCSTVQPHGELWNPLCDSGV